jgi:hypothetical protein
MLLTDKGKVHEEKPVTMPICTPQISLELKLGFHSEMPATKSYYSES